MRTTSKGRQLFWHPVTTYIHQSIRTVERKIAGTQGLAIFLTTLLIFFLLSAPFSEDTPVLLPLLILLLILLIKSFRSEEMHESIYPSFLENCPEIIVCTDKWGKILTSSKGYQELFNEKVINKKISVMLRPMHKNVFNVKDREIILQETGYTNETISGLPVKWTFYHNITEKKNLEEKVGRLNEEKEIRQEENDQLLKTVEEQRLTENQLRLLSAKLQSVREQERTRIAREIHDELGQILTGLKMDLYWVYKKITDQEEVSVKLKGMVELVDKTIHTVRRISTELRPGLLDDLGLIAAIEWQCNEFQKKTGIKCHFTSNMEEYEFDQHTSTEIFRILQESLTNVLRHSGAANVYVDMNVKDVITVEIKDDGVGITPAQVHQTGSLGILGMKERVRLLKGSLTVCGDESGTSVKISVPLKS